MKISIVNAVSYRIPLVVTQVLLFENGDSFPVCPRCKITLQREYQAYCDRCGQCLNWNMYEFAQVVHWTKK